MAVSSNHAAETIEESKSSPLASLGSTDTVRQVALILALAIALALAVFLAIWAQEPNYRPLGKLETQELVETLDFLDKQGIKYQLKGDVVSVPEDQFSDIQMQLMRAGLGSARTSQDFLTQGSGFGVSQQLEQARLKRSQEENLAQAISELRSVTRARVLLALPRENVFARQQQQPSATVVVTLGRGSELAQSEVDAIVDLVASAVHNLSRDKVTITDQHGRLLHSGSQDAVSARGRRELELQVQQEQLMMRKIDGLLIPVLGLGQYSAQVAVQMDFSSTEQTMRTFSPDVALRSEMVMQDNQTGNGPIGIPGALTNQPPMDSIIPQQATGENVTTQTGNGRSRSEATRNFELDSTVSHTRNQVGTVQRVTVSVAVDHRPQMDSNGTLTMVPRSDAELQSIQRLLAGTVGLDTQRGDVLEVISVAFAEQLLPPELELPLYEQPWFWRAMRMAVVTLLMLALLLIVVRPMVRKLLFSNENNDNNDTQNHLADLEDQFSSDGFGLGHNVDYSYGDDGTIQLPDLNKDDDALRAVRALVSNEPELAARVVQHWLEQENAS
ncbi:MAG: flagellar basal-body MS-ring/collar protein FliF [Ferrimonas sp.]